MNFQPSHFNPQVSTSPKKVVNVDCVGVIRLTDPRHVVWFSNNLPRAYLFRPRSEGYHHLEC